MQEKLIKCLNSLNSTNAIVTASAILKILNNHDVEEIVNPDFKSFHQWLSDHHAKTDGVNVKVCEYGNGVFANRDFSPEELITCIPQNIMLSTAFHQRSDLNSIVEKDLMLKSMDSLVLTLQLLQEDKDENSFYRPYLNILPRRLLKLPIAYTPLDLDSLKGSHVQYEAALQIILHIKEFLYVFSIVNKTQILSSFNWADFVWARGIVLTRQNKIPVLNGSTCLALIPFFDMFNHKKGEISTFFNPNSRNSETFANQAIFKGDQVYISYGNRSNADLFLFSGFVDMENSMDVVKIWIDFSDKLGIGKLDLLKILEIPVKGYFEIKSDFWNSSKTILLYLCVVYLTEKECSDVLTKLSLSKKLEPFQAFDQKYYKKAVDWILMRCKVLIASLSKKERNSSQVSKLFQTELRLYQGVFQELISGEKDENHA